MRLLVRGLERLQRSDWSCEEILGSDRLVTVEVPLCGPVHIAGQRAGVHPVPSPRGYTPCLDRTFLNQTKHAIRRTSDNPCRRANANFLLCHRLQAHLFLLRELIRLRRRADRVCGKWAAQETRTT